MKLGNSIEVVGDHDFLKSAKLILVEGHVVKRLLIIIIISVLEHVRFQQIFTDAFHSIVEGIDIVFNRDRRSFTNLLNSDRALVQKVTLGVGGKHGFSLDVIQ